MGEEFEFEDYFSDDGDPGLLIEIEWDGRKVPFRIKRHLNLGDKQRIRAAGVKVGIGANGKAEIIGDVDEVAFAHTIDRKSTRLNSSHTVISYAVFCLKKKKDSSHR